MAHQAVLYPVVPQTGVSHWISMIPGAPVHDQARSPGFDPQMPGNLRRCLASGDLVLRVSPGYVSQQPQARTHSLQRPAGDSGRRLLDDHLHDVPDPVYGLLEYVASKTPNPLTVILERDGNYPPMLELLSQMDRARVCRSRISRAFSPRPLRRSETGRPLGRGRTRAGENRPERPGVGRPVL